MILVTGVHDWWVLALAGYRCMVPSAGNYVLCYIQINILLHLATLIIREVSIFTKSMTLMEPNRQFLDHVLTVSWPDSVTNIMQNLTFSKIFMTGQDMSWQYPNQLCFCRTMSWPCFADQTSVGFEIPPRVQCGQDMVKTCQHTHFFYSVKTLPRQLDSVKGFQEQVTRLDWIPWSFALCLDMNWDKNLSLHRVSPTLLTPHIFSVMLLSF